MKKITIYTDGSCLDNPGTGGWGAILLYQENKKVISGGEKDTTNNKMELMAVIEALKVLKEPCDIDLYLDSTYVKNGITSWINTWKKNGWKTANKKEVKNQELWQILDKLQKKHNINWHWVKAHENNKLNNEVDNIARKTAESIKSTQ